MHLGKTIKIHYNGELVKDDITIASSSPKAYMLKRSSDGKIAWVSRDILEKNFVTSKILGDTVQFPRWLTLIWKQ